MSTFQNKPVFVAGSGGMVGRSTVTALRAAGYNDLITPSSQDLDLTEQQAVREFFAANSPAAVIVAAAKVGGILANDTYRADFIYTNLMIEANVIHAAFEHGVEKLILLGSSCIYPKMADQPLAEESLLSGYLEFTNEPYAVAKIAGIKMCESYFRQYGSNFIALMPTNLYGPHDNFDLETSHVIPALMRKFADARERQSAAVDVWGTGTPRREFMHVDDLAAAIIFTLENVNADDVYPKGISHLNVGTGTDISIAELAQMMKEITGFQGSIRFDSEKPDGTPRKLLDVTRMRSLGWHHKIGLREGLEATYNWFCENYAGTGKAARVEDSVV